MGKNEVKILGVNALLLSIQVLQAKAAKAEEAANGEKVVEQTRNELALKDAPKMEPFMTQEHASLVAEGKVPKAKMNQAYWTIDDIHRWLQSPIVVRKR